MNSLCIGVHPRSSAANLFLTLFHRLQPGVDHFLDPMQLCPPSILSVIEPLINSVKSLINGLESSIHMRPQIRNSRIQVAKPRIINKNPHQYSDRRNPNGKRDLNSLIRHPWPQHTPF